MMIVISDVIIYIAIASRMRIYSSIVSHGQNFSENDNALATPEKRPGHASLELVTPYRISIIIAACLCNKPVF